MTASPSDRVTLKIPRPLYLRLRQVIQGTGFRSVNEFVVHVLRDLVAERGAAPKALTPEEIEAIRRRLRTLGYLD
ncbi:CopG family transcriptional regulator [Candidatus Bipolaricaulota bacterium]|nr:CopG family transcriptional regulator [Candidatus Bipolaricaulota bacterium]